MGDNEQCTIPEPRLLTGGTFHDFLRLRDPIPIHIVDFYNTVISLGKGLEMLLKASVVDIYWYRNRGVRAFTLACKFNAKADHTNRILTLEVLA